MGQRVGQINIEFEITHSDRYVNQALVLEKSPSHPSLESMAGAHGRFFFFITMMRIRNLGLYSDFLLRTLRFYPCLELLNRTMMH